jgi:hypothetical protein
MRQERDYVGLASILLRLAAADPASEAAVIRGHDAGSDAFKVIVGTIVNNHESYFLVEESSPHAYRLANASRARSFAGKKVRVRGALQTPHILNVETINEVR